MSKRSNNASADYEEGNGADGQKKQRQDGDRVRLLILGRYGGPLIGKGGENFKRLREQYDVKITGLNSRENVESLQLVGSRSECLEIVKVLLPQCPEARYPSSSKFKSALELNLLANTNCVGAIIGKKGTRMKEITDETGITLKVYPECLPNSNERVVAIGGKDDETVIKGLETVLNVIDSVPGPHHTTYWKPENGTGSDLTNSIPPGMGMGNMSATNMGVALSNMANMGMSITNMNAPGNNMNISQSALTAPEVDEKNVAGILVQQRQLREQSGIDMSKDFGSVETVTTLSISNELCGVVIGQGGSNIKYIKQVSGAKVETSRAEKGSTEKRTITLTGTQDQIQIAEQLMAQCIRAGNQQPGGALTPQQQRQQQQNMSHQEFLNQLSQSRNSNDMQPRSLDMPWGRPQGRGRFMVS